MNLDKDDMDSLNYTFGKKYNKVITILANEIIYLYIIIY